MVDEKLAGMLATVIQNYLNEHPDIDPVSFKAGFNTASEIWSQGLQRSKKQ